MSPAALLTVAATLFGLMSVLAKRAMVGVPGTEVALVRFLVGIAGCALVATRHRYRVHNGVGLFWRGAFGGVAVLLYFLAIQHLPVGIATLLNYTSPVFTSLFAFVFLGEKMSRRALSALALTMGGVALVMHGAAPLGGVRVGPWHLVGLASAMLSGAAIATMRDVRKTDGSWEIFASFCLFGALITGVPTAAVWVRPSAPQWGAMIAVGLVSIVAQILMTYALAYVRAATAGIISQLTPVCAMALGWILFGEQLSALSLTGAALTLLGVALAPRT